MARTEEAKTVAAVAKALAGNHPPEIERILVSIAARAARDARQSEATGSSDPSPGG